MIKKESYYNSDGELVTSKISQFPGRFNEEKGYMMYFNGHAVNGMARIPFPLHMRDSEIAYIAKLSRYLLVNTNVIGYRGNRGYKAMTVHQIGDKIGLGERQTYRFLKRMTDLGMIAKMTVEVEETIKTQYVMNPIYFLNGRNVSDSLYWIFQEQLDALFPAWVREAYRQRKGDA